jgi:cytoskeletal protein RodZ
MHKETLGQVFQRYRQAAKIKIEQVEKNTKISRRMLVAIENDDYKILPDEFHTANIIKGYAKYLGLDYNKLLLLYKETTGQDKQKEVKPKFTPVRVYLTPNMVRSGIIILVIILVLVYFGLQLRKIYVSPQLIITSPVKDLITTENFVTIQGQTEKEARVFINEKEVFLDPQGYFQATLDLQKGLNYLKISAVKKHSRANTVYRQILLKDSNNNQLPNTN